MALGGTCENEPLFVFPVEIYVKRKKRSRGISSSVQLQRSSGERESRIVMQQYF